MSTPFLTQTQSMQSTLVVNAVLRNTYLLLSLTLLFSAAMAGLAMVLQVQSMPWITIFGYFGLFFLVSALRNSSAGILAIFAFTGFMGFTLGPMLNLYIAQFANGAQMVMTALGGTGLIFLGLSAYVLQSKTDFNYLSGFLMIASIVPIVGVLFFCFMPSVLLIIVISGVFVLLSSGMILFETSRIMNGGERNYIMATISLYMALYNLFVSLLQLLALFSGRRE